MAQGTNRIAQISRAIGLAALLSWVFNVLLAIALACNRMLAWVYARACGLLGMKHYDHRFTSLRGPEAWRWAERGFYLYSHARHGDRVLDVCCGDGLFAGIFLRDVAAVIHGVDLDPSSIAAAQRRYGSSTVRYSQCDVLRDAFPGGTFTLASCFATLQYFAPAEAHALMRKIARSLTPSDGRFVGSVPVFSPPMAPDPAAVHNYHSVAQAVALLQPHFGSVSTWCSVWQPGLTHCYFMCQEPRVLNDEDLGRAVAVYESQLKNSA